MTRVVFRGSTRVVELGSCCDNTTYNVFATTPKGRVVFCDAARGLPPWYVRSPPLAGIKDYNAPCSQAYDQVAQALDGVFLLCGISMDRSERWVTRWVRGDHYGG